MEHQCTRYSPLVCGTGLGIISILRLPLIRQGEVLYMNLCPLLTKCEKDFQIGMSQQEKKEVINIGEREPLRRMQVWLNNDMWSDAFISFDAFQRRHQETVSLSNTVQRVSSWTIRQWTLCTIRSHGTKLHILVSKLRSETSKTKAGPGGLVRVALFWKFHCATCSPACVILYHVTGSSKGPIQSYSQ